MIASGSWERCPRITSSFVIDQLESVRRAGWEVVVGPISDRTSLLGVFGNFRRIRRLVREHQPLLIHAQYGSVISLIAGCASGKIPYIISFCGSDLLGAYNVGVLWQIRDEASRIFGIISGLKASAIIVKSENLLRALPSWLRQKSIIIPNGVNTDRFKPLDRAECRRKLGWPVDAKIVVMNQSSRGSRAVKNLPLAKAAVGRASRTKSGIVLQMIGSMPSDRMPLVLNAADCLLVTSLSEGSPNIVKEAMACNLPVVTVPCGDVAARLKNVGPGGLCAYDSNELAKTLKEVFDDGRRSNGREQLIMQGLDESNVTKRLISLYLSVLEKRTLV